MSFFKNEIIEKSGAKNSNAYFEAVNKMMEASINLIAFAGINF